MGAEVGVKPSGNYLFMVFVTPVGPSYKAGFAPVRLVVQEGVDRAAPRGVGDVKAAGNYAVGMRATVAVKERGYSETLYLDPHTKRYVDESGASNFLCRIGQHVHHSIESLHHEHERPPAGSRPGSERGGAAGLGGLPTFDEAGALGTAAVITPVGAITYRDWEFVYAKDGKAGPIATTLYERLQVFRQARSRTTHG